MSVPITDHCKEGAGAISASKKDLKWALDLKLPWNWIGSHTCCPQIVGKKLWSEPTGGASGNIALLWQSDCAQLGKNREIFIIGDRMVINVCIPTIFSAKVETDDKGNIEEEQLVKRFCLWWGNRLIVMWHCKLHIQMLFWRNIKLENENYRIVSKVSLWRYILEPIHNRERW